MQEEEVVGEREPKRVAKMYELKEGQDVFASAQERFRHLCPNAGVLPDVRPHVPLPLLVQTGVMCWPVVMPREVSGGERSWPHIHSFLLGPGSWLWMCIACAQWNHLQRCQGVEGFPLMAHHPRSSSVVSRMCAMAVLSLRRVWCLRRATWVIIVEQGKLHPLCTVLLNGGGGYRNILVRFEYCVSPLFPFDLLPSPKIERS